MGDPKSPKLLLISSRNTNLGYLNFEKSPPCHPDHHLSPMIFPFELVKSPFPWLTTRMFEPIAWSCSP